MERIEGTPPHDQQGEGKLTDELLEEKLHEGKGPLPFVPGGDGEKLEPPVPEKSEPPVPESTPEVG